MSILIRSPHMEKVARVLPTSKDKSRSNNSGESIGSSALGVKKQLKNSGLDTDLNALDDPVAKGDVKNVANDNDCLALNEQDDLESNYVMTTNQVNNDYKDKLKELEQVRQELSMLKAELADTNEMAREEGYKAGFEQGLNDSREQTQQEIAKLQKLIASVTTEIGNKISQNEDSIIEIIVAAMLKIMGEVMVTRDGIVSAIRHATSHLLQKEQLAFRLSPNDYELLSASKAMLTNDPRGTHLKLLPDENVKAGGCILESVGGTIDSRLEIQLKNFIDTLLVARSQQNMKANR